MATYQSVQSASIEGDTLTITKPTGLAVGDYMLAGIWTSDDGGSTVTLSTPAGWTQIFNLDPSAGAQDAAFAVFSKVADSSDVAASNFSFTAGGGSGTNHMIGHLLRITSLGLITNTASNTASSGSSLTITGFTPTRANCLYVIFAACDSTLSVPGVNTYAMATDNPTWTERAETIFNDTTKDSTLAVATATRAQITATGNFTVTFDTSRNNLSAAVVVISPQVNGSLTQETKTNAYAHTWIQSADLHAVVDNPNAQVIHPQVWTPVLKS